MSRRRNGEDDRRDGDADGGGRGRRAEPASSGVDAAPAGAARPASRSRRCAASATSCRTSSCAGAPSSRTTGSASSATASRRASDAVAALLQGAHPHPRQPRPRAGGRRRAKALREGVELIRRELLAPARGARASSVEDPTGAALRPRAPPGPLPRAGARPRRRAPWSRCSARATRYKDRLLRPALVKVAKGDDDGDSGGDPDAVH